MGFQAERGPKVSRRIRSKRRLLGFSIGLAVLWPGQRGPIRSRVIVTGLLPGSPVASAVTLSTTVAVCNVYRPVHIGLILTDPTAAVRASKRRLSWPGAMFTASVARLRRVPGIHRLDGNPLLGGFVANLGVELRKAPPVQPSIHLLAVVHVLADVL